MSTFTLQQLTIMLSFSMSLTFCAYNQYNAMDGTIPSEVGKLGSLKYLYLGHESLTNSFDGSIPTEIGLLSNLTYFLLENNKIYGAIPTELGLLVSIFNLKLSINELTGTVPTELGNLLSLGWLDLSNNELTGTVPTELGNLLNIYGIYLYENLLTGSISLQDPICSLDLKVVLDKCEVSCECCDGYCYSVTDPPASSSFSKALSPFALLLLLLPILHFFY